MQTSCTLLVAMLCVLPVVGCKKLVPTNAKGDAGADAGSGGDGGGGAAAKVVRVVPAAQAARAAVVVPRAFRGPRSS